MVQTDEHRPMSITNVSMTALVFMVAATLFGMKSGRTEGDKPPEKQAEETAGYATMPAAAAGAEEPHRAFILNYLRGPRVEPAGTPLGTARSRQVLKQLLPIGWALGLPTDDLVARTTMLALTPPFPAGYSFTKAEAEKVEILVATVPDPIDTPFGFWYDEIIESLTRAICDTNQYAPAGQWSPWEHYQRDARGKNAKTAERSSQGARFEQFPGVLLFRGTDEPDRVLAVLLVSETTNRVRAEALKRALNLAGEVQHACNPPKHFRLIAPHFTGSQPSLFRALKEWAESNDPTAHFEVISGSAGGLAPLKEGWERQAITLHATVIPSLTLRNAAIGFLKRASQSAGTIPSADCTDVALLVESNTGFGRAVQQQLRTEKPQWPMYLPYPMHISRLQAVYAKKRLELEKRFGLSGVWTERNPEEHTVRPNADSIVSLGEAVTAPINDQAVDDITTTIRQNRVRYVGILATDPQDKVFLVQRIKKDCPNVDIFLTSMELFYTLPENRQSMRGVIVATTYPLYPPNQWWIEPKEPRRQTFKSQCGLGYYNAAAFHLADVLRGKDSREIVLKDFLQEYAPPVFAGPPTEWTRPPVWILAIGEKGHPVPLAVFKQSEIKKEDGSNLVAAALPPCQSTSIDIPPLGQYRVLASLVLVILAPTLALLVWRPRWLFFGSPMSNRPGAKPKAARATNRWEWLVEWWDATRLPMRKEERRVSTYHNLILSCFSIILTPILGSACVLLTSSFAPAFWQYGCLSTMAAFLAIVWAALLFLQLRLIWRYVRSASRHDQWNWYVRLLTHMVLFLGSFVFGIVFLIAFLFTSSDQVASRILFVERATGMSTGYSVLPVTLLMSAACLIHAYFALKRDYLGHRFKVKCPYPLFPGGQAQLSPVARLCQGIGQLHKEVYQDLTDFAGYRWRHRNLVVLCLIAFVPASLLIGVRAHVTWEGRLWDVLFLAGFLCLAALELLTLMRFLAGWKGLERILKLIALVPMVRAFDRLPRKTATLFGGYLFARRPRLSHLAIPAHILRQLQDEASKQVNVAVPADVDEPVLSVAATDFAPASHPPNEDAVRAVHGVRNGARSPMPSYDASPVAIARRLNGQAFDYMSQTAADPERTPDRDFPSDQINEFSAEAQRLVHDLEPYWPSHTVADAFGEQLLAGEAEKQGDAKRETMPAWVEKAEDFVAIQVIIFLSQHFILLRTMALSLVWVSVFLLLAATSYPFQPEQLILYLLLGLLGLVIGVIFWVLVRLNKNEIVSRITQSTPNKFELNWSFFQAALQFIAPIAIIVAAQLSGRLRTIVEPLLDVIK